MWSKWLNVSWPCMGSKSLWRKAADAPHVLVVNAAPPCDADHDRKCHFTESRKWLNFTIVLMEMLVLDTQRCVHASTGGASPTETTSVCLLSPVLNDLCLSKALSVSIQSPLLSAFIINGHQQAENTYTHTCSTSTSLVAILAEILKIKKEKHSLRERGMLEAKIWRCPLFLYSVLCMKYILQLKSSIPETVTTFSLR